MSIPSLSNFSAECRSEASHVIEKRLAFRVPRLQGLDVTHQGRFDQVRVAVRVDDGDDRNSENARCNLRCFLTLPILTLGESGGGEKGQNGEGQNQSHFVVSVKGGYRLPPVTDTTDFQFVNLQFLDFLKIFQTA